MSKEYTSLGLMSGTSGDGVDASIIRSDGHSKYNQIKDEYFEYDNNIYENIHDLKEKINNFSDLQKFENELNSLERQITLFHAKVIQKLIETNKIDVIGFHGQTIYHNAKEKISKQLGDGKLLSQLAQKDIIYNFRENDINNGGEGAPLTPIFHELIIDQKKIDLPVCFLNIGGISNVTIIKKYIEKKRLFSFTSKDIGPGNCLIDTWIRKNSKNKFDKNGRLASLGSTNKVILEQAQELLSKKLSQKKISLDVNDFDVSFARGLSLEDGAATLTNLTAIIISSSLSSLMLSEPKKSWKILISGGGRKNKFLIKKIKENILNKSNLVPIDDYNINGDFVESQAFAFLAIRSNLKLPISFPGTTGCSRPSTGGEVIKFK